MRNFPLAVALTMLLSGCTTILSPPVLIDCAAMKVNPTPNERVHGQGFSVLPPAGAHWCVQKQTDNEIFFMTHKLLGEYVSEIPSAEEQFHTIGAGAMTLKTKEVNISTRADLREFVRQWLQQGMRVEQENGSVYAALSPSKVGNFKAVASRVVKDQSVEADCVRYKLEGSTGIIQFILAGHWLE